MNVLIVTPLYKMENSTKLKKDTEAIHYLVKEWVGIEDVSIRVVLTYLNPGRNLHALMNKDIREELFDSKEYEVDGVSVYRVCIQQFPFQAKFNYWQNNRIAKSINHIIEQKHFAPDLIVFHCPIRYIDVIDKLKASCPYVGVMHITDIFEMSKNPSIISGMDKFTTLLSRSQRIRDNARKLGLGNADDFIVNSGVPKSNCYEKREWDDLSKRDTKILYVGTLIPRKHADILICAFKQLSLLPVSLTVVGKGILTETCHSLANELNINEKIVFIPSLLREQVYQEMRKSDIFILPSTGETLGLVYLEAMREGCITIGTRNEGIDGIIEDGINGFLLDEISENSISEMIKKILKLSVEELRKISSNAIATAQRYNDEDVSMEYLKYLRQLERGASNANDKKNN